MKRFASRRVVPALVVLSILGLAVPVTAGDSLQFRGRADETTIEVLPLGGTLVQFTINLQGEATHLGRFTGIERTVIDLSDLTFTGPRVFIAANGDRLFADVHGAFMSATTAEGTLTFTGGTGRFRSASGAADFLAASPDLIHIAFSCEGSIRN
jgi:hypothetical protein